MTANPLRLAALVRTEGFLLVGITTAATFLVAGDAISKDLSNPLWFAVVFVWLFGVILGSAISVVRHAEAVATAIGEPAGTLVLTLSVTMIEVFSISAVMLHGESNPTLVRDTLFSVVMIILGAMVGLSLLIGGWRHREQAYNLQGANAYLGVIVPLVVLSLVMPDFTTSTPGPTLAGPQQAFLVLVSLGLYAAFLSMQTGRHRGFFTMGEDEHRAAHVGLDAGAGHAVLLLLYMAPIVFLAEHLARPVDYLVETLDAPAALGGAIIAVLVATPEAIGAIRAAVANRLQRATNIFLGSVLSTIGLTIPAMILVGQMTGQNLVLGVEHADLVLLLLTLAVSIITFASGRTNVLQGLVHLILFGVYVLLIVEG
ncbi:putative cation/proton antiporter [Rhodovulum sp. PH10]|uniref:calcium:proton antiporter n=1 Tax=Rhodovulum sp. PH10 TaxID=1187851 RepID=UPI00027C279D|nr:calcium:proton antiporter [Rhodovulum sp. PH10]EJW12164.1 putative cation/proton antiporter [Rhodovulum sp. PH10]